MFKKALKLFLSCAVIASIAGCGTKSEAVFKAGTYSGTATGRNGEVTVEVVLSDSEIKSVTVKEHQETQGIADAPIEKIPAKIVETQSVAVDTVSGATITSEAIIEAVKDAIRQSGADPDQLTSKEAGATTESKEVEMEANIVVVGGGAAGISTAVSAAYEGATNIVLLEKMGSLGGNAIRSGGFIEDLNPGEDRTIEMNESYKNTIEEMIAQGPLDEDEETVWDELVSAYDEYKASGKTTLFDCPALLAVEYHRVEGSPCMANMPYGPVVDEFDDWFINEIGAKMSSLVGIVGYTWPRWTYPVGYHAGAGYFDYMTKYIDKNSFDINIMTETAATELLTDESGAVIGVIAEGTDGTTYKIKANSVALTTGGFSANGEMLMQYDTQWGITTPDIKTDNNPGDTGDGILMAEKLGAMTAGMDNIMMFPLSVKGGNGFTGAFGFNGSSNLMVNTKGERFVDETASRFEICHAIFGQEDPYYYIIADTLNANIEGRGEDNIKQSIEGGVVFKADTIEELAQMLNMDATTLEETIAQYNKACESGEDELFGRTSYADGSEIVQGPFYATALEPCSHITIGGLVTSDNYEVLTTEGEVIPNLYAAGETVVGSCGLSAFAWGKQLGKMLAK